MKLETRVESEDGEEAFASHIGRATRFCFVIVFASAFASAADDAPHTLIWRDGSSLHGRLTSATADEMTIVSPIFSEPLVVDSSVIGEIQFGRSSSAQIEPEPFLFSLKDGAMVTGSIGGITEKQVTVRNRTVGELTILVADLISIQKANPRDVQWGDTSFASDSKPKAPVPPPSDPFAKPAVPAVGLFQPTRLPERCDIVLKMRTQPKPAFRVIITGANSQRVTIEAKDGDLILQGRVFTLLKTINAVDGAVNLHLYWNQRTGQCALCTSAGAVIAETNKGPVGSIIASDSQGVLIQDAVPNFAIAYLGTNSWDGLMPLANELDGPGVMLSDDSAVKGRVVAAENGTVSVRGPDGRLTPVPIDKIVRIRFVPDRSKPSKASAADLWVADGSRLNGRLTSVRDGVATFESVLSAKPLLIPLAAMRQMISHDSAGIAEVDEKGPPKKNGAPDAVRWKLEKEKRPGPKPEPVQKVSRLEVKDRVLLGELADGAGAIHWKPTGAKRAVPIAAGLIYSISRPAVSASADGAVFHLANGEILSGKLTGMTGKEVEGEWAFGASFKLPAGEVRAIQFPSDRIQMKGFGDEAWVPNAEKGSAVSLKEQEAQLSAVAAISHPDVMRASDIQFTWQPEGSYAQLEITLFQAEAKASSSGALVRLYCSSNRLRATMQRPDNGNLFAELGNTFVEMNKPITVKLAVGEDAVAMRINDSASMLISAKAANRAGSAMTISSRQSTGLVILNNLRLQNGAQLLQRITNAKPIRIRDFSATTNALHLRPAGGVNEVARLEALQIPRFRQDSPPKQVIVAANRDLLRGEVEALAADHVLFRTGLETVKVPLSRLAAIMTPLPVKKPDEPPEKKEEKEEGPNALLPAVEGAGGGAEETKDAMTASPLVSVLLNSGGRVRILLDAVRDGAITGRHPNIGACRIPLDIVTGIETRDLTSMIASKALETWRWELAPEPVLPETGGQSSLAIGKDAATFKLLLLGGGDFDLAAEKGRVVVLDFWATWCGPCVKSLPGLTKEMAAFPPDKVRFIGVNQGEGGEVVKRFLVTRGIKMTVAMDGAQSVARQYGVEGIPHTVIIDREGKVAWEKTGYSPDGAKEAAAAVTRLLGGR